MWGITTQFFKYWWSKHCLNYGSYKLRNRNYLIGEIGKYWLWMIWKYFTLKKKKKTHFTSFMNFYHFGKPQLFQDSKCSEISHFCLTYNTLIVQINNTICHIFNYPICIFFYFFCLSFHLFLGNLSLIIY